ncbi:MAG: hypothetical protein M0R73_04215 [Dehalococcoidia bacterium]|nr:hypothetical protein [Dehalococcoidia bacterium]
MKRPAIQSPGRLLLPLAAVAMLAMALTAAVIAARPASAQEPGLVSGEVPAEGLALLRVTAAATPPQVAGALQEQACQPVSISITVAGAFVTYVPDAPPFVNAAFPEDLPAGQAFIVRCASPVDPTDFSAEPVDETGREGAGIISDVRIASHVGFDRFVLEFSDEATGPVVLADGVPAYRVEYIEASEAVECGSGFVAEVEGAAILRVDLPFAYIYNPETGQGTVEPLEITTDYQVVRETEEICGFEGQSTWVIGLTGEQPFRVTELADPARLVIDIVTP